MFTEINGDEKNRLIDEFKMRFVRPDYDPKNQKKAVYCGAI